MGRLLWGDKFSTIPNTYIIWLRVTKFGTAIQLGGGGREKDSLAEGATGAVGVQFSFLIHTHAIWCRAAKFSMIIHLVRQVCNDLPYPQSKKQVPSAHQIFLGPYICW